MKRKKTPAKPVTRKRRPFLTKIRWEKEEIKPGVWTYRIYWYDHLLEETTITPAELLDDFMGCRLEAWSETIKARRKQRAKADGG